MRYEIDIGSLRHRIGIQSASDSQSSSGESSPTFTTVATVWGKIEPLSGRELFLAQQTMADSTHKVTIRYYSGLSPKDRFAFGSRYFNIQNISDVEERNRMMICIVKEEE